MKEKVNQSAFVPCLNLELRKANRVMSQIYDGYLTQCGLKTSQYSILRSIYLLRQTTNKELQDILVLDQTTLTRGLTPLIRDGYITVQPGVDRRQKNLSLSVEGKTLFKRAEALWQEAQQYASLRLGEQVKEQLLALSKAVVDLKS